MNDLVPFAHDGAGPGPWVLFFPLIWAALVVAVVLLLGRFGPRRAPWRARAAAPGPTSPVALLGQRYALGEVDEPEYRRRLAVLRETVPEAERGGGGPPRGRSDRRRDEDADGTPGGAA